MMQCSKCGELKDLASFGKDKKSKNGLRCECRSCRNAYFQAYREANKEKIKAHFQVYYAANSERRKESSRRWHAANAKRANERSRKWHADHPEYNKEHSTKWNADHPGYATNSSRKWRTENPERDRECARARRASNPEKVREYFKAYKKKRCANDPSFKLERTIRTRINMALKLTNGKKADKSIALLGCTIEEVRNHIAAQFSEGMTWANHGRNGWHIDHIVPCAAFDLTDPEQQRACFHYSNLQPLWATDNIRKGDRRE